MQKSQKLFTIKVNESTFFALKDLKVAIEKRTRKSITIVGLMAAIVGKYETEGIEEQSKEGINPEE